MGMRFSFKYGKGDIKLSGKIAEAAVELGFWDNEKEHICVLSWSQVNRVLMWCERSRLEEQEETTMDMYKRGVLTMWLSMNNTHEEVVFA